MGSQMKKDSIQKADSPLSHEDKTYTSIPTIMSAINRRSRPRNSSRMKIDDDRINDLLSRLQQLLPELRTRCFSTNKALASKVLQETCDYIRYLQREVDDLSDQLLKLLDSPNVDVEQAAIIRHLVA